MKVRLNALAKRQSVVTIAIGGGLVGAVGLAGALGAFAPDRRASTAASATPSRVLYNAPAGQNHPRSAPAAPPPGQRVDCRKQKCVAITFDDGPVPDTLKVLDMLKAKGARATFFILGMQAVQYPDVLKRIAAEGHQVGNHTFSHVKLAGAPAATVQGEITRTQNAIKQATGSWPTVFRPTYGATDTQLDTIARQHKLAQILWSVDTVDWRDRDTKKITERVLNQAQPGGIVILHDVKPTTVAAVPEILNKLSQKGFAFVTVSEIYGGQLKAGEKYPAFLGSPIVGLAPAGY